MTHTCLHHIFPSVTQSIVHFPKNNSTYLNWIFIMRKPYTKPHFFFAFSVAKELFISLNEAHRFHPSSLLCRLLFKISLCFQNSSVQFLIFVSFLVYFHIYEDDPSIYQNKQLIITILTLKYITRMLTKRPFQTVRTYRC